MKKPTCEMCESTDFIKQDGLFVCQSCGVKYSVEEAKKLMTDGVDVETKTALVDNSSKLDNLYKLARRAKDENNTEKATHYYEQILLESPTDWEAMFYSNYYGAIMKWNNGDKRPAIASLQNSISSVLDVVGGTDKAYVAITEMFKQLCDICSAFYGVNRDCIESIYRQYRNAGYSSNNRNVLVQQLRLTTDINIGIARVYYTLGAMVQEIANDNGSLDIIVEDAISEAKKVANGNPCAHILYGYTSSGDREITAMNYDAKEMTNVLRESCDNVLTQMKQKQEILAKQRVKEQKKNTPSENLLSQDMTQLREKLLSLLRARLLSLSNTEISCEHINVEPKQNAIYDAVITRIVTFGAFAEYLPGKIGMIISTEIAHERIVKVDDVLKVGDKVRVKVIGFERSGSAKLSIKALH
jgi:translation initiation factor 2 alpha subunit (eIF-2alpha)